MTAPHTTKPAVDQRAAAALVLRALLSACRRPGLEDRGQLLDDLDVEARRLGIRWGSPTFDRAAERLGLHYSRNWDLYLTLDVWGPAEGMPFLA